MMTRREFGAALAAGAAVAASAQSAQPQPAAKRTIVDAQVHLWKANSPDWPWEPGAKSQLPEPFTIERALPMMDDRAMSAECSAASAARVPSVRNSLSPCEARKPLS